MKSKVYTEVKTDQEGEDALWKLVAQGAPLPSPKPWFTARTLARLRQGDASDSTRIGQVWGWGSRGHFLGLGGFAAVVLGVVLLVNGLEDHRKHLELNAALEAFATDSQLSEGEDLWFVTY
jgi:hypothetical protein